MRRAPTRHAAGALLALTFVGGPLAGGATAAGRWTWPVRGEVIQRFALSARDPYARGQHRGIDVAAPRGTPVRAACAGRIRFAGTAGGFGRAVSQQCGAFVVTYGHLASVGVTRGEAVGRGARIGAVGTSGHGSSPGPHVHLGIRRATDRHGYIDPLRLLPLTRPTPIPPTIPPGQTTPPTRNPHPSNPAPQPNPNPTPSPAAVREPEVSAPHPTPSPAAFPGPKARPASTTPSPAAVPKPEASASHPTPSPAAFPAPKARPASTTPSPAAIPTAVLAGLVLLGVGVPGLALFGPGRAGRRRRTDPTHAGTQQVAIHNPPR